MNLIQRVKSLRIGRSFNVKTESDRTQVLNAAKALSLRIVTKARKQGGFTVTRLPE